MSLIDKKFLLKAYPDAEIKKIPTSMTIKGIDDRKHNISEYVKFKI